MHLSIWVSSVAFLLFVACKTKDEPKPIAEAILKDANGKSIGKVQLGSYGDVITRVDIDISTTSTHAAPGTHAVHIHEIGNCEGPTFASAGGHFNPNNEKHGGPEAEEHHAGDLGNIELDTRRRGNARIESAMLYLKTDRPSSVVGRAVIVHQRADDFRTQNPPGDAGDRIACGIITLKSG